MTDLPRVANRHGQNAPPLIVRYEVYAKLSDYHAECWVVLYRDGAATNPFDDYEKVDPGQYLKITVYCVNDELIGEVSTRGWAIYNQDSDRFENISGGGDSVAVVTIEGTSESYEAGDQTEPFANCLFKGKTTSIADEGYCDEDPYTTDDDVWVLVLDRPGGSSSADPRLTVGDRFIAKRVVSSFTIGEGEDADDRPIYAISKRGDGAATKLVMATSATHDSEKCLWAGKIAKFVDDEVPSAFCTDPFDIGTEIWILWINSDLGSYSTAKSRLSIGEQYLGHFVGTHPDDEKPVYAIRIEQNDIYHVTLGAGIAAGATGPVSLPINGGTTVTARNWSDANLSSSDKVAVFKDWTDLNWYILKSGGQGANVAIVEVYSGTKDANCVYAGKLAAVAGTPTGYCTDPFANGDDVFIVVLNETTGSWSASPATLTAGEKYLARHVAQFDMGGGVERAVYAIRIESTTQTAVVKVANKDAGANCLWPIFTVTGGDPADTGLAGYCADPFTANEAGYLLVVNSTFGSFETVKTELPIDDYFVAHYLGKWHADGKPVFVVRAEDNYIYAITLSTNIAAGATGTVTLPTGGGTDTVTARNWSNKQMDSGDKVHVYRDLVNNEWFLIKSNAGVSGARLFKGYLTGTLNSASATVGLDSVIAYDNGTTPGTLTANNVLSLAATSGDVGIVVLNAASGQYDLVNVKHVTRLVLTDATWDPYRLYVDLKTLVVMDDHDDLDDIEVFELPTVSHAAVTNVFLTGYSLWQTKKDFLVLDVGPQTSSLIHTGTDCSPPPTFAAGTTGAYYQTVPTFGDYY